MHSDCTVIGQLVQRCHSPDNALFRTGKEEKAGGVSNCIHYFLRSALVDEEMNVFYLIFIPAIYTS
jgi:hypothetical protein